MPISDATREDAQRLVQRYPLARSALLPLLHLVQSDEGYVSEDGIAFCAETLGMTKAEVGAVSTFYTMYKREPFGDYLLSVCTNPTCKIAGGQDIFDSYVEACGGVLDREAGVMVEHAECLGICDAAPVVQINYEMYGPVDGEQAKQLLEKARAGDPPASNWSGTVPPVFSQVQRELSGIEDGVDEYLIGAAREQARAEVPPAYRSGETDLPVSHPGADPAGHGGHDFRDTAGLDLAPTTARGPGPEETDDPGKRRVADEVAEEAHYEGDEMADATAGASTGPTPGVGEQPASPEGDPETAPEAGDSPAAGGEQLSGDEADPAETAGPDEARDDDEEA